MRLAIIAALLSLSACRTPEPATQADAEELTHAQDGVAKPAPKHKHESAVDADRDDRNDQAENAKIEKTVQSAEAKTAKKQSDCQAKAAAKAEATGKNCFAVTENMASDCIVRCIDKPPPGPTPEQCANVPDDKILDGCPKK